MRILRRLFMLSVLAAAGCSSFTDVPPPSSIVDPSAVQSQDGALTVYRGVISQFADLFGSKNADVQGYAYMTGIFSDEYYCSDTNTCGFNTSASIDLRRPPVDATTMFQNLQKARLSADQAAGLLAVYAPATPQSFIGQMHALKGYIYIMFGEFFCSGVPFGQAPYGGDVTYGAPRTTQQMFEDAIAQFDTALTYSADSARIQQLAMMGKGRALLDLGRFADAAAAVAGVATDFRYDIKYSSTSPNYLHLDFIDESVGDHEGANGLDFASSNDVRMALTNGLPSKFSAEDAPVSLADGIEARLIDAEAKLQANKVPEWRDALNALRTTAEIPALPDDSTINASATVRQNVMFRERAFWLFGTGHRQGDLRRLIRQYGRLVSAVYPMGTHAVIPGPFNLYSSIVVVDPPPSEAQYNPHYQGCLNHDA